MPLENADLDGIRREQQRLLATVEMMRRVQAMTPGAPPDGLTEADLARRLVYDLITTLTRNEVVLISATEAIVENNETLGRIAEARATEIELRRREVEMEERRMADEVAKDQRRWGVVSKAGSAFGLWIWTIAANEKTVSAIVGAVATAVTGLVAATASGVLHLNGCSP